MTSTPSASSLAASVSTSFAHEAHQYLERGDAQAAIALCTQGLSIYPQYVTAYLILARALLSVGDYLAAERAIEQGIQIAPRLTGLGSSFGSLRKQFLAAKSKPSTTLASLTEQVLLNDEAGVVQAQSSVEAAAQEAATALREVEQPAEDSDSHREYLDDAANPPSWRLVDEAAISEADKESDKEFDKVTPQIQTPVAETPPIETLQIELPSTEHTQQPVHSSLAEHQQEGTLGNTLRLIETAHLSAPSQTLLRSNNLRLIPGLEFTSLRIESGFAANTRGSRNTRREQRMYGPQATHTTFGSHNIGNHNVLPELPEPPLDTNNAWHEENELSSSEEVAQRPRFDHPEQFGFSTFARFRVSDIEHTYPTVQSSHDAIGDELDTLALMLSKAQMPSVEELSERPNMDLPLSLTSEETMPGPNTSTVIISETMAKIYESQGAAYQALEAYRKLATSSSDTAQQVAFQRKIEELESVLQHQQNDNE